MSVKQCDAVLQKVLGSIPSNMCLNEAIRKRHIVLDAVNPGQTVVHRVGCENCGEDIKVTVDDLASQSNSGGDYEDGSMGGGVVCRETDCGWQGYLTGLCQGKLEVDCGKFHNHCTECKGYGSCMGDYRMAHCDGCNKHYFCGLSGFGCPKCEPDDRNGFW